MLAALTGIVGIIAIVLCVIGLYGGSNWRKLGSPFSSSRNRFFQAVSANGNSQTLFFAGGFRSYNGPPIDDSDAWDRANAADRRTLSRVL
jgi:hypothetical protein